MLWVSIFNKIYFASLDQWTSGLWAQRAPAGSLINKLHQFRLYDEIDLKSPLVM